jgi:hypothetical protein
VLLRQLQDEIREKHQATPPSATYIRVELLMGSVSHFFPGSETREAGAAAAKDLHLLQVPIHISSS